MSVNVKLKDEIGQFRVYEDVDTITVNTDEEGVLATFYLNRGFDTPEQRHNNILKMKQDLGSSYYVSTTWQDETDQTLELISFKVSGIGTWLITPTNAICIDAEAYFSTFYNTPNIVFCYGTTNASIATASINTQNNGHAYMFYKVSHEFSCIDYSWTREGGSTYTVIPDSFTIYDGYIFAYYRSTDLRTYIGIYNSQGVFLTHWFGYEEAYKATPTISPGYFFYFYNVTKVSDGVFVFHNGAQTSTQTYYSVSVNLNTLMWYVTSRYDYSYMYPGYRPLSSTLGIIGTVYSNYTTAQDYLTFINRTTGELFRTTNKFYWPNLYWSGTDTSSYQLLYPFFFENSTHWFLSGMYSYSDTSTNYVGKNTCVLLKIDKSTLAVSTFTMPAGAMQSFYFDESSARLFYVCYNDHKLHILNVTDLTETTQNLHSSGTLYYIRRTSRGLLIHSGYGTVTKYMDNVFPYYCFKDASYGASGEYMVYQTGYNVRRPMWPGWQTTISATSYDNAYGAYFFDLVTNTFHTIIDKQFMFNICTENGNCLVLSNYYSSGTSYNANAAGFYYFDQVSHTVYAPTQAFRNADFTNLCYAWHLALGDYIIVGGAYRPSWYQQPYQYCGSGIFVIDVESMTYNFYESPVSGSGSNKYTRDLFYYWCITPDNALWFRPSSPIRNSVWRIKNGQLTEYTNISGNFFFHSFTLANRVYVHFDKLYEYANDTLTPVRVTANSNYIYLTSGQNYYSTADIFDTTFIPDYWGLYGAPTGDTLKRRAWAELILAMADGAFFVPVYYLNSVTTTSRQIIGYLFRANGDVDQVNIMHSAAPLTQVVYQNVTQHKLFVMGIQNNYSYSGWLVIDTAENTFEWVAQGTYNVEKPNTVAKATFETAPEDAGVWVYYPPIAKFVKWYYDFSTEELTRFTWEDMEAQEEPGEEVNL